MYVATNRAERPGGKGYPMKRTAIIASALAVAGLTTGCGDGHNAGLEPRVTELEQRVTRMDQRITDLESQIKKVAGDESNRRGYLQGCLTAADVAYKNAVQERGKKEADGTYSVPPAIFDELRRQKVEKIEECEQLYSK